MIRTGVTCQPDPEYLEMMQPLFAAAEFLEVTPETCWWSDADGRLVPNAFHAEFLALARRLDVPVVAHGVDYSLGSVDPGEEARTQRWLERIAADHADFGFAWYTDHLGTTKLAGETLSLPLPLPMVPEMVAVVRERLRRLQAVVPRVGLENSVFYFLLGDWMDEPAFINAILDAPGCHLLLDLHNVYTMALNQGADPEAYLARLDLDKVIEIHLSGGGRSDPEWLPEGRSMRLDSHDSAIPEAVWRLFEAVLPRCRGLQGVCIERLEGSLAAADVPLLQEEMQRAKEMCRAQS